MTDIKLVIFDLDGTISDSWPTMLYCYRQTLNHYGFNNVPDEELWSCFVGDLQSNLSKMLHIDDPEEISKAVSFYRMVYEKEGHAKSKVFDGIVDCIKNIHSKGYKIGLATMTLEKYAINTLKEIGIYNYFDSAHGSLQDGSRPKSKMIELCMKETGISNENTLMIGDGYNDQKAASITGVHFLAAAYGFGITEDNCKEEGIKYVMKPDEILEAVINY